MKPTIKFVQRKDGVSLAYSSFGQGPTLVYPAPWVTNLDFFLQDPVALNFWMRLARVFTVVLYDKHGCGQSDRDRKDFTLEADIWDLETIIESLDLKDINIFGISAAGPLSIVYSTTRPEKVERLILYGAFVRGKATGKKDFQSALISLVRSAWGFGSKALSDIFVPGATKEQRDIYAKFQRESCSAEIAAKLMELNYSLDVSDLLLKIKSPTMVLHRDGDKIAPFEQGRELASRIPNACFKFFKGNIHLPWLGNSSEIIQEILDFVGNSEFDPTADKHESYERDVSDVIEQASIVFTDIVSSTEMVTEKGDTAARDIFIDHDNLIRDQLNKYKGKELQNLGDGFMLSFPSASSAISCSCAIQKEMSEKLPFLKIRIGINFGEVVHREGNRPFGQAVVMASRILSRCKGGEILISDITRQLAAGSKFSFREIESFKAKGFNESVKLFEVVQSE